MPSYILDTWFCTECTVHGEGASVSDARSLDLLQYVYPEYTHTHTHTWSLPHRNGFYNKTGVLRLAG